MATIFIIVVAEFDQQVKHLFTVISRLRRSWKKADIATIHEFMQSIMGNSTGSATAQRARFHSEGVGDCFMTPARPEKKT